MADNQGESGDSGPEWIKGYSTINPGDSYAHSPKGADSTGPMSKSWGDQNSDGTGSKKG